MDISICFADFPTEKIGTTTRAYRQLGIGYANLGALLMATGHAYDSDGGRAIAAAITSLMTGAAYKRSAELAKVVGPYDGYEPNAAAHKRVMRMHSDASAKIKPVAKFDRDVLELANKTWQECVTLGEANGYRNAQASLLAPTGCLTPDTLVTTDRGLVRLGEIGDLYGDRWQDLDLTVSTDEGPRRATRFFVNGEEPTRRIVTKGGYKIQGTLTHRVKVVNPDTATWEWKRLADIVPGDLLPMQMRTLVGEPREVPLPVLDQAYYTGDRQVRVPASVTPYLAELVGYFMGDGSLHAKGIRLCVADTDLDVAADSPCWPRRSSVWNRSSLRKRAITSSSSSPSGWRAGGRQPGSRRCCRQTRITAVRAGSRGFRPPSWRPTTRWFTARSCAVCSRPTERFSRASPASRPRMSRSPPRSAPCC